MGENTGIEWADHTFNPWSGCTKVSPACDHCYAEALAKRAPATFGGWGAGAPRRRTSAAYWRKPLAWNRRAAALESAWAAGVAEVGQGNEAELLARGFVKPRRPRVFCASLADVFDNQVDPAWREDLWALIHGTPHLDWLLLTKRPQNIAKMLPGGDAWFSTAISRAVWGNGWPNVWLGTTVENQAEADRRIPHLLQMPAAVRFLSCEPLLGPVDLTNIAPQPGRVHHWSSLYRDPDTGRRMLNWVIAGGESGPGARPMHPDWARSLRDQCAAAGVPFFFKQWGDWLGGSWSGHEEMVNFEDTAGSFVDLGGPLSSPTRWEGKMKHWGDWPWEGPGALRVGKKAAGRLLDGREHNEVPK